jgi:two-component system NtrC family sensor kinase
LAQQTASSIEKKLTLYVVLCSVLLGLLFSGVQIGTDYVVESQRFDENAQRLINGQRVPSALALYNYDSGSMKAILDSLLVNPAVLAARIVERKTGYEISAGAAPKDIPSNNIVRAYSVVLYEPEAYSSLKREIGELILLADEEQVRKGFEGRALTTLLLDILRNIVLAFVLILVFRTRLTGPIKRLAARLLDVDLQAPSLSLEVENALKYTELDDLACKMNDLLRAVNDEIAQRKNAESRVRLLNEQLEEKVKDRTKELHASNHQLQNSIDELQRTQNLLLQAQRMASLGHLAAGMAHEINNPVAIVYSNIATLSEYLTELIKLAEQYKQAENQIGDVSVRKVLANLRQSIDFDFVREDAPDLVRASKNSLERVRNIVGELRTFANSDQQEKSSLNLKSVMDECLNDYGLLNHNSIRVYALLDGLPEVKAVRSQVMMVFGKILKNAIDALSKGGTIEIAGEYDDESVSVFIKDTGVGMSEEDVRCAINPFFTRKEIGAGIGLGLTVAYNLMLNHGGELSINSENGKGTVVILKFPFTDVLFD